MKECRGDLLGRVRRGLASAQERTAFEAHLSSCDTCRMTLDVMGDFDAAGDAEPGDSELVARIAAKAARTRAVPPPTPLRPVHRHRRLAVAALVLAGTAAASGLGVVAFRFATRHESPTVENASQQPAPKRESPARTPAPVPAPSATPEPSPDAAVAVTPPPKVAPVAAAPTSASELYRAANDARRAGRTSDAIRGYKDLQRRFPDSSEAKASRVSLGGLLLRGGSASDALAQFNAYLDGGSGQLAAEALFGRGRALQALGRSAEETENLERLLRQYPNSAYATHAKRRLDELR
jgi:TolA-binding protein